jgi:hypothetical protein
MSDLLSAASLFLAVLGLLYSAWYSEMTSALEERLPRFAEDRSRVERKARAAYRARAIPLAVGSIVLTIILLPKFINIVSYSIGEFRERGLRTIRDYDVVSTLFCAIVVVTAGAAVHMISIAVRLRAVLGACSSRGAGPC